MDAVSFLVSRKSYNPYKISGGLFLATLLACANYFAAVWLENNYGHSGDPHGVLVGMFGGLTALAVFFVGAGVFAGAPMHQLSQLSGALRRLSENRILDELTSTGISTRAVVNQLLKHYLKRLAVMILPTTLFWTAISQEPELYALAALYILSVFCLPTIVLCLTCWKASAGARGRLFIVAPVIILFGPPAILFHFTGADVAGFVPACIYAAVIAYFLSIRALKGKQDMGNLASKLRRVFQLKRKITILSENAIVARQEAVGREWGDLFCMGGSLVLLLGAMLVSVRHGSDWPVLNVMLLCGFIGAWRAATKLSLSLTSEMESSTLEILRTTPLGSERFLSGWLDLTLRPLWAELGLLSIASFAFILTAFPAALLDGSYAFCLFLTLVMPYLGALFGSSIAGQLKTRTEVNGQLGIVLVLGGALSLVQASAMVAIDDPLWISLLVVAMLSGLARWVLKAGATKSLNRVFLPQK